MVTFLVMVTVLGMATIPMTNDHPRDGGHPVDRLEYFDHFGELALSGDGDNPRDFVLGIFINLRSIEF